MTRQLKRPLVSCWVPRANAQAEAPSYLEVEYSGVTGSKALVLGDDPCQSFLVQRQGGDGS